METLSLEKFNPKKAELVELSQKYTGLVIKGIDDITGYKEVDEARKDLKKQRVMIEKQGKEFRAEAIKFQKDVIAYEKELVGIIEPLEIELINKQDAIDLEKKKIEMAILLPDRKERLSAISIEIDDNIILGMDIEEFENFFIQKKTEFLAEKERKENEERKIKEATENARIEAEKKAELEKQELLKKAESEKQAIIDENNRKENARIEAEEKSKKDEADKLKVEKENQEKLEKQKKYQKFLKDNNYNENEDYLLNKDDKVILMRKVAEFNK